MPDAVIEAKNLTKTFDKVKAVDGIDLSIRRGEIFGLLGPNGAGKSTTLKMLVTILRPTAGQARVAGIDVIHDPAGVRRKVGIVFQEPSLDTLLTGRENLELHGRIYGVPRHDLRPRVDEMLHLVDLEKRAHDLVKTYSGGMKRRLEIARGLLHKPQVLFLDEPTLGLDPATRERIWAHIRDLRNKEATTIVLTTHYMEEADSLCDRIAIIDKGRIAAQGTPRELKAALGGDLVTLGTTNPHARSALQKLSFVSKIEERAGTLVLTVRDAGSHLAAIINAAGDVRSVEVRPARLEDVFLAHTGHGLRDAEEQGEGYFDQWVRTQSGGSG